MGVPTTSLTGVLGATYDAASSSLENGRFSISFDMADPPMLGVTPNDGLSGGFRATWVGP